MDIVPIERVVLLGPSACEKFQGPRMLDQSTRYSERSTIHSYQNKMFKPRTDFSLEGSLGPKCTDDCSAVDCQQS
jgi:hypothetical protein